MESHSKQDESGNPLTTSTKRRQFFATGMRCLIVGGIGSFAAMQEMKRRRLIGDPNCVRLNTCSDCVEFSSGCSLDKAEKFRAEKNL